MKYESNLKQCITIYQREFEHHQKSLIFGNISQIYEFHHNELNRQLNDCHGNVELIGQTFYNNVQEGKFYCYVVYGMQRGRSREICRIYDEVFQV